MASIPRHRRKTKIRRTGRHTTPSQVERVAQQAGRAAPAVAVVGALAAAPQLHEATSPAPGAVAGRVAGAHLDAAILSLHRSFRLYTVRSGDTLSGIAERFYGHADDWHVIYHANRSKISNPGLIYPGEVLRIPHDPAAPRGRHHKHHGDRDHDGDHGDGHRPRHARHHHHRKAHHHHHHGLHGTLGCHGLEDLWRSVGGARWAQVTAASIAMAESGGRQYATGPFGERGYWQINPVNGSLSTYNARGNARAAIILSHNGRDWSPWTTYVDGAYRGRC